MGKTVQKITVEMQRAEWSLARAGNSWQALAALVRADLCESLWLLRLYSLCPETSSARDINDWLLPAGVSQSALVFLTASQ